jgi:hypothetical protein
MQSSDQVVDYEQVGAPHLLGQTRGWTMSPAWRIKGSCGIANSLRVRVDFSAPPRARIRWRPGSSVWSGRPPGNRRAVEFDVPRKRRTRASNSSKAKGLVRQSPALAVQALLRRGFSPKGRAVSIAGSARACRARAACGYSSSPPATVQ